MMNYPNQRCVSLQIRPCRRLSIGIVSMLALISWSNPETTAFQTLTRSHVLKNTQQNRNIVLRSIKPPPLDPNEASFSVEEDDEDDVDDMDENEHTYESIRPYRIDYDDDDENEMDDIQTTTTNNNKRQTYTKNTQRLDEREDRFYVGQQDTLEHCILIGVQQVSDLRISEAFTLEESMSEMRELIRTAGMQLVGEVTQRLQEINPRTFIGSGKVTLVKQLLLEQEQQGIHCSTLIFDAELTPGQQKQLENVFNPQIIQNDFSVGSTRKNRRKEDMVEDRDKTPLAIKVIDRTALILDIFAQHAKTREGKLQVDLALHVYRKPRLTKMWTHLERQSGAGGVGLRGPGETQIEIDRRLIRDRIIVLKEKISAVQKHRSIHRRGRDNMGLPILALVGYTNAGKSTLLNYLTQADVLAENMLFATLDPTTRKVKLPGLKTHPEVLLTDTVGFIQKLPTQLVAAFRATLEEVQEADVLLHVMDVSHPSWEKQEQAVLSVLEEIGAANKPIIRVFNKIDLLDETKAEDIKYEAAMSNEYSVAISSLTGDGMIDFVSTVEDSLMSLLVPIEALIPYKNGKEMNMIQEVGHVELLEYRDNGTFVRASVPQSVANRIRPFLVSDEATISRE